MISHPGAWAVGLALLSAPAARGDESWVGLQVLNVKPKIVADRDGDGRSTFELKGSLLPVLKDQGGRLRVRDYLGREGWTDKAAFVRVPDAPAYFTAAIRKDEKDPFAWCSRGVAWALNGQNDQAIPDYTEAIRLDPKYVAAYLGRAGAWGDKREWDKAIRDLDEAIRINPAAAPLGPPAVYNHRGTLWLGKKEYDKAIRDFDEAVRIDPTFALAFNHRGNAWEDKGDADNAIRDYSEAIRIGLRDRRLDRADPSVFVNRGNLWLGKKEYAKALADFDEALRLDPKYNMAIHKKAYLLATCADDRLRDVGRAEELMKVVVELRPKGPLNEELLGVLAAARGKFEDAIAHQSKALENAHYADRSGAKARERLAAYRDKKAYRE
ncbi:MAG TPA: tetratricopeptide repeat protein [Gemmataceae bacterium]|nr:tetratricopeptide repeat protein [Gemmataceae bacterium]